MRHLNKKVVNLGVRRHVIKKRGQARKNVTPPGIKIKKKKRGQERKKRGQATWTCNIKKRGQATCYLLHVTEALNEIFLLNNLTITSQNDIISRGC